MSAPATLGYTIDALPPISLGELVECASLQTRVDRKYVLSVPQLQSVLDGLPSDTRVLDIGGTRGFAYHSVYFDTPDLVSYLLTAQRRRRRFKIRTRIYVDSAECWLEVKTRGLRGNTVKTRMPYELDSFDSLQPGRGFVDETLAEHHIPGSHRLTFRPTLTTRYRRTTLYLPGTNSRVTIDTELSWRDDSEQELSLPQLAIVETKTGSTASPVDRMLWQQRYRPSRISKFGTGLAALRPDLPCTPWRRVLRRDFLGAPCLTALPPVGSDASEEDQDRLDDAVMSY